MTRAAHALALFLCACSSAAPPPPPAAATRGERWAGSLSPPPATGAEIVAEVNGDRIYRADVETQMQATGQGRDQALGELIDALLFSQEALRRGLADDDQVREARERESVRLLLERDFEAGFARPEDIPADEVDKVFHLPEVHDHYEHPELHVCAYLRAPVARNASDAEVELARQHAEAAYALLTAHPPANRDELWDFVPAHPELALRTERGTIATTATGPAHKTFAVPAMALTHPGELSHPVRTLWGWDLIYLDSIVPALHTPPAERDADIRKHWFPESRKRAFERWVGALMAPHQVTMNPPALDAVTVDALVGLR
jgi:hypothetical protein